MSMLAERRKKAKWTLNPTGRTWADDKSKFGQRMLERMGWEEGQGLGAQLQGPKDIIRVSTKNDKKGIGCKGSDETWTKLQGDYEKLLKDMSATYGGEIPKSTSNSERRSLEEISKSSRARIHYAKFIRGKDMSRYSDKDLACIFGKPLQKSASDPQSSYSETNPTECASDVPEGVKCKKDKDRTIPVEDCSQQETSNIICCRCGQVYDPNSASPKEDKKVVVEEANVDDGAICSTDSLHKSTRRSKKKSKEHNMVIGSNSSEVCLDKDRKRKRSKKESDCVDTNDGGDVYLQDVLTASSSKQKKRKKKHESEISAIENIDSGGCEVARLDKETDYCAGDDDVAASGAQKRSRKKSKKHDNGVSSKDSQMKSDDQEQDKSHSCDVVEDGDNTDVNSSGPSGKKKTKTSRTEDPPPAASLDVVDLDGFKGSNWRSIRGYGNFSPLY